MLHIESITNSLRFYVYINLNFIKRKFINQKYDYVNNVEQKQYIRSKIYVIDQWSDILVRLIKYWNMTKSNIFKWKNQLQ